MMEELGRHLHLIILLGMVGVMLFFTRPKPFPWEREDERSDR